ncbi:MAG: ankyrin repeat domain-containing protein [Acidobacteriota bacterium]
MDDLWRKALIALDKGNFSQMEDILGGPDGFDRQIIAWYENGDFDAEPEMLAEALSCACMLNRTETARYLLDNGVYPYAGMKTWLAGPHYAVSGGHLDTVKMLIEKKIPLELENGYRGTLLGQALWSAVNEHKASHAEIIELLINAGAEIDPGTFEWWLKQNVPSADTKKRVEDALRKAGIS